MVSVHKDTEKESKVDNNFGNEFEEYETFITTTKSGEEVELAVVDSFVFEEKHYIVAAKVEDDTILEDALFVYKSLKIGDEIEYAKIEDADEYTRIAEAYAKMDREI